MTICIKALKFWHALCCSRQLDSYPKETYMTVHTNLATRILIRVSFIKRNMERNAPKEETGRNIMSQIIDYDMTIKMILFKDM